MTQERQRLVSWEKTAKGRGLRWRILRDVIACLRLHWMTFEEISEVMSRLRGITRNKTREMLDELKEQGDLDHVLDKRISKWVYGSTVKGSDFWLNSNVGIPAGLVQVVEIARRARRMELAEVDESD
ncbi:hypothetical protein ES703_89271 [subsurface metagenome]